MRRLNKLVLLILRTNIPRFVILFAVVLTVSSVTAQHSSGSGAVFIVQWNKKCNMPGPLYAFDAATLGDKIYAIGGRGKEEGPELFFYLLFKV